jgi:hypothetical protein
MSNKRGGDILQHNAGGQSSATERIASGVADSGFSIDDTLNGTSYVDQAAVQAIIQAMRQGNYAFAGNAGADNVQASPSLSIT